MSTMTPEDKRIFRCGLESLLLNAMAGVLTDKHPKEVISSMAMLDQAKMPPSEAAAAALSLLLDMAEKAGTDMDRLGLVIGLEGFRASAELQDALQVPTDGDEV